MGILISFRRNSEFDKKAVCFLTQEVGEGTSEGIRGRFSERLPKWDFKQVYGMFSKERLG